MVEKKLNEVARVIFDKVTQNTKEVTGCQKSPDGLDANWERGDAIYYRGGEYVPTTYTLYRKEMFYKEGNILYAVCFFPIIDQIRNQLPICDLTSSDIFRVSCFLWERSWKTLWRWKLACYKQFSSTNDNDKEDLKYMCPILRTILNEHEEKERKELEAFLDKKKKEKEEKDMERISFLSDILRKIKK